MPQKHQSNCMRSLGVLCVGVVIYSAATACGSGRATTPRAPAEPPAYRFPHQAAEHAALGCVTCHQLDAVLAGAPARPGTDDHAPCDQSGCHADAFVEQPGQLCTICHTITMPWKVGGTQPAAYPPARGRQAYPSAFSHAVHLDKARVDRAVGFHVACGDCHQRGEGEGDLAAPGHAACLRCHVEDARPALDQCASCHANGRAEAPRGRRLIRGDLRFRHAVHETDRAGREIRCRDCHADVAAQTRRDQASLPETGTCVACHDDRLRTPPRSSISNCATCHDRQVGRFASVVAPRSHLPPRDRPDDHTLAFRKDHGIEAGSDGPRCARCHDMMSGSSRDNCDECHQVMKPQDHDIAWRELEHGPESATAPERCVTCHDGDFCVACHSRPPRSHLPVSAFRNASVHGQVGKFDTRACFTCHLPTQANCTGSGCHEP